MGDVEESDELFDLVNTPVLGSDETKNESKDSHKCDVDAKLKMYEKRFELFQAAQRKITTGSTSDLYIKSLQRDLIEQFHKMALAVKRCDNCSAFSPPFRKDGAAKIFQKPTPKRQRKSMAGLKLKYKTALHSLDKQHTGNISESDSDDDLLDAQDAESDLEQGDRNSDGDSEHGEATEVIEHDKYLPPSEVEGQIKLLWQQQAEMLNFIWMRAFAGGERGGSVATVDLKNAEGWRIFFMRIVLVTPNRFRPAAKIGESISDHPQNTHLKRILEFNSKIRLLQLKRDDAEDAEGTANNLSKLVSIWIDLQNAVNCYMDSSKDPNPLGTQGAPIGIRQILERKEGLFRRHMMGKRVNYCARSVISPDPYIGTNEIGIPVHFAKVLHYPTPVNDWNVKHMRTLVERGPDQYPGKFD
jgi:DNA-directed RNA polymerase I subunit RPA1